MTNMRSCKQSRHNQTLCFQIVLNFINYIAFLLRWCVYAILKVKA